MSNSVPANQRLAACPAPLFIVCAQFLCQLQIYQLFHSRWLAPLLTYTLPIPAIFIVWDAIFSRRPRDKDANFKLDFLVDVTSAMLIALRKQLLRLAVHHLNFVLCAERYPALDRLQVVAFGMTKGLRQNWPLVSLQLKAMLSWKAFLCCRHILSRQSRTRSEFFRSPTTLSIAENWRSAPPSLPRRRA